MADPKTMLVMPGRKYSVNRVVKRAAQTLAGAVLAAVTIGAVMVLNGLLSGKGTTMQWIHYWLGFIQRPDIIVTMLITAMTTVLFVYWQRDKERGR
jgi:uncharacterized membrane protein